MLLFGVAGLLSASALLAIAILLAGSFGRTEQRILGCIYGSCNPPVDFPRILGLHRRGRLDLDSVVSRRIPLEQVNEAFAAMAAGEAVRTVVVYD